MAHHRLGAAQLAKLGEQMEQPRGHFFIGIEANPAIATIRQPGRQRHPQLAARRLLPLALMQPQLNLMKFSLAHDPGQAEQQTVMIGAPIVYALAVGDQHSKQRAQFQELMPIVVVARREASRLSTSPAFPRPISAIRRWKPPRVALDVTDCTRWS